MKEPIVYLHGLKYVRSDGGVWREKVDNTNKSILGIRIGRIVWNQELSNKLNELLKNS